MEKTHIISDGKTLVITTNRRKLINLINATRNTHPDQVTINTLPESNNPLIATLPADWLHIKPPKQSTRDFTPEQKQALLDRLHKTRTD